MTCASSAEERFAAIACSEKPLGCPVQMPLNTVNLHVRLCDQALDVKAVSLPVKL
jgi:hypothetical protein